MAVIFINQDKIQNEEVININLNLIKMKKLPKKNDISIMEINKNNRNTFSRRKMVSLKKLFFMKKKRNY